MGRTFVRQNTQIRQSDTYTDTNSSGSTMESGASTIEDDLNNIRSQIKRILDDSAGNWYDDLATVNTKKRDIKDLNTDLDDLEEKRIIFPVEQLTNVSVPANAYASGSIVAVAKANLSDGETFVLNDGYSSITFEFDVTGDGVSGGNTAVDVSADTTDIQVASRMVSAINGTALNVTADNTAGTSATVDLDQDHGGTRGNTTITETVSDAGFVATSFTGGAGDVVVLSQSSSETPSVTAAVDAGTAEGAVVAALSGDVGANDLAEVTSANATVPKNRCLIRDSQLREGLTSNSRQIYGLIQVETGVVDGDSFNDSDHQVQLSFVRINDTTDDLEPCPGEDIGGQSIEYVYPRRTALDNIPEDANFPIFAFTDGAASVAVTLDNAIDNQGTTPATQSTDIDIDIASTKAWAFRDALSADLLKITEGNAGSSSEVLIGSDVDTFNVDAAANDFLQGATFDSGGTSINVGVTAGEIDSAGALAVKSGGGADLTLQAALEMILLDSNKSGSSYAGSLKLSETQQEWTDFESVMEKILGTGNGEVSLLKAITTAAENRRQSKVYAVNDGSTISANTDVGGPSSTANNVDTDFPDMTIGAFLTDYDVYVNGTLLRPDSDTGGANDHDYYPGSNTGASGVQELKFEFPIRPSDQICIVPYV
jgi:hypothetical protein